VTASTAPRSRKAPTSPSPSPEGAASPSVDPARPPKHGTPRKPKDRTETYEVERPDGTRLKVVRNVETGEATYSAL
jgi:hypothetical protein